MDPKDLHTEDTDRIESIVEGHELWQDHEPPPDEETPDAEL